MGGGASTGNNNGNPANGKRPNNSEDDYDDDSNYNETHPNQDPNHPENNPRGNDPNHPQAPTSRPDFIQTQQHPAQMQPSEPQRKQNPAQYASPAQTNGPRHDSQTLAKNIANNFRGDKVPSFMGPIPHEDEPSEESDPHHPSSNQPNNQPKQQNHPANGHSPNHDPDDSFPESDPEDEEEKHPNHSYPSNPYHDPRNTQNPHSPHDPRDLMTQPHPNQVSQHPNFVNPNPNQRQPYGDHPSNTHPQNPNNLTPNFNSPNQNSPLPNQSYPNQPMNNPQKNPLSSQKMPPDQMSPSGQPQQPLTQSQPFHPSPNQVGNPNYLSQSKPNQPNPYQPESPRASNPLTQPNKINPNQAHPNQQQPIQQQPLMQNPSQQLPNQQQPLMQHPSQQLPSNQQPLMQHPSQQLPNQQQPLMQHPSKQLPNQQVYGQPHPSQQQQPHPSQQQQPHPSQQQQPHPIQQQQPNPSQQQQPHPNQQQQQPLQQSPNQLQPGLQKPNQANPSLQQSPNQTHPGQQHPDQKNPNQQPHQPQLVAQPNQMQNSTKQPNQKLPHQTNPEQQQHPLSQSQPKQTQSGQPQPNQDSKIHHQNNPIQVNQVQPTQQPTNQLHPTQQQLNKPQTQQPSQQPDQIQPIQRQVIPNSQLPNQQPSKTSQQLPPEQNPNQFQPTSRFTPNQGTQSPQQPNNTQPNPMIPQQTMQNKFNPSQPQPRNPDFDQPKNFDQPHPSQQKSNILPNQSNPLNPPLNTLNPKINNSQSPIANGSNMQLPQNQKPMTNQPLLHNPNQPQSSTNDQVLKGISPSLIQNPSTKGQPTNTGQNPPKQLPGPLDHISQPLVHNPDIVHSYLGSLPNNIDSARGNPQQNLPKKTNIQASRDPSDPSSNQKNPHTQNPWQMQHPSDYPNHLQDPTTRNNPVPNTNFYQPKQQFPDTTNNVDHPGDYFGELPNADPYKKDTAFNSKQPRLMPSNFNPSADPTQVQPRFQRMVGPNSKPSMSDQPPKNANDHQKQTPFRSFGESTIPQNNNQPHSATQSPNLRPQNRFSNPRDSTPQNRSSNHMIVKPETQFYNPRQPLGLNPKDPDSFPPLVIHPKVTTPGNKSSHPLPQIQIDHPLTQKIYKNYPQTFIAPDPSRDGHPYHARGYINQPHHVGDGSSPHNKAHEGENHRPQVHHRRVVPHDDIHGRKISHSPISGMESRPMMKKERPDIRDTLPFSIQGTVPNTHTFDPYTYAEPKYNEFSTRIDNYDDSVTVDPVSPWKGNQKPHHLPNVYSRPPPSDFNNNPKLLNFDKGQNPLIKESRPNRAKSVAPTNKSNHPNDFDTYHPNAFHHPIAEPSNYFLKPETREPVNKFPQPTKAFDFNHCVDLITSNDTLEHLKSGQPLEFVFNKVKIPNNRVKARIVKRIFEMDAERVDLVRQPSHIRSLSQKFMHDAKLTLTEPLHYLEDVLNEQDPMRLDLHNLLEVLTEFFHFMGFFLQHEKFFNYYDRWWRTPRDDEYISILKSRLEQAASTLRNDVHGAISSLKDGKETTQHQHQEQNQQQQPWNYQRAWGSREVTALAVSKQYLSHLYYELIHKKKRLLSGFSI